MNQTQLVQLMALGNLPGLGNVWARTLIARLSETRLFFTMPEREIRNEFNLPETCSGKRERQQALERAQRDFDWMIQRGVEVIGFEDSSYPQALNHHHDSPIVLYKRGTLPLNDILPIAVVGSRRATSYGMEHTRQLVCDLAPYNACIVSGLAHGIDAVAHRSAISHKLPTVAVLGHGFDRIYPKNHGELAGEVAKHGALISEFPPGTELHPSLFPRRNRIIAALSVAVVVMEATTRGGALTTARYAFDYQRELFALPGPVGAASSEGCHRLIKQQKAHLFEGIGDLVEVMGWNKKPQAAEPLRLFPDLTEDERRLFEEIKKQNPCSIDELSRKMGWAIGKINACCTGLELKGVVKSTSARAYYAE